MNQWPSSKARRVLVALTKIGWQVKRQSGSHKTLSRSGWPDFVFAFHDNEEVGPKMTVKLPSTYTGQQIFEAFKGACSFQTDKQQYSAEDDSVEYQYEPGSVRQTIKKAGARLVEKSCEFKKMFGFFGPTVKEIKKTTVLYLPPSSLTVNIRKLI